MDSRGKSKLALMIFLSLPLPCPQPFIYYSALGAPFKGLFLAYCLLYLHQPWNGSCRQLDKWIEKLLLPESNQQKPLSIHKPFCFSISKTSTISPRTSLKSDAPVPLIVSTKGLFYPVMPRAEVHHWVMNRTQPAALESKGRERERERDGLRKAEQILIPKYAGQINGVNEAKSMKSGLAAVLLPYSYFLPRFFLSSSFPPIPSLNMSNIINIAQYISGSNLLSLAHFNSTVVPAWQ